MAGGRPTTYTQEMLDKCYEYLKECPDLVHSIVGMCLYVDRSKAIVYDWAKDPEKPEFSDIVRKCNELQEQKLINGSLSNELNASISKMMLSHHGHVERKEVDNISSDGSMSPKTPSRIELVPVHDNEAD